MSTAFDVNRLGRPTQRKLCASWVEILDQQPNTRLSLNPSPFQAQPSCHAIAANHEARDDLPTID